jgi:hypothetical protein
MTCGGWLVIAALAINAALFAVNGLQLRRLRGLDRELRQWIKLTEGLARWHANRPPDDRDHA